MVATIWPTATLAPTSRGSIALTTPAQGAVTAVSIFMALTTISVSPAATVAPGSTLTSMMAPGMGHSTPSSPSGTASETLAAMAGAILPPPNAAACCSNRASAPDAAGAAPAGEVSSGFSARRVVRASPARTSLWARMARNWRRLVGSP